MPPRRTRQTVSDGAIRLAAGRRAVSRQPSAASPPAAPRQPSRRQPTSHAAVEPSAVSRQPPSANRQPSRRQPTSHAAGEPSAASRQPPAATRQQSRRQPTSLAAVCNGGKHISAPLAKFLSKLPPAAVHCPPPSAIQLPRTVMTRCAKPPHAYTAAGPKSARRSAAYIPLRMRYAARPCVFRYTRNYKGCLACTRAGGFYTGSRPNALPSLPHKLVHEPMFEYAQFQSVNHFCAAGPLMPRKALLRNPSFRKYFFTFRVNKPSRCKCPLNHYR